jgi:hypothetical protein
MKRTARFVGKSSYVAIPATGMRDESDLVSDDDVIVADGQNRKMP